MAIYKTTRNCEATLVDFLTDSLAESPYSWENITITKSFAQVYELTLPVICLSAENTSYEKIQIGDNSFERTVTVIIDFFAENDGMKLDLKDSIIAILKDGCPYYEYKTKKEGRTTVVDTKTQNGRIRIINIDDTPVNFAVEKDKLDIRDRYRHRLTLTISLGRIE